MDDGDFLSQPRHVLSFPLKHSPLCAEMFFYYRFPQKKPSSNEATYTYADDTVGWEFLTSNQETGAPFYHSGPDMYKVDCRMVYPCTMAMLDPVRSVLGAVFEYFRMLSGITGLYSQVASNNPLNVG